MHITCTYAHLDLMLARISPDAITGEGCVVTVVCFGSNAETLAYCSELRCVDFPYNLCKFWNSALDHWQSTSANAHMIQHIKTC